MAHTPASSHGATFTGGTIVGPFTIDEGGGQGSIVSNANTPSIVVTGTGGYAQVTLKDSPLSEQVSLTSHEISLYDAGIAGYVMRALLNSCLFGYVAAPADVSLAAGQFAFWLDATPGIGNTKLMIKAKDSGGTVRTAAIALA